MNGLPVSSALSARREGFGEHALLDRLALGVERFELCRDDTRLVLVVGCEQLGAEARGPHPAACIDARPENVAERVAGRCRIDARDIGERTQADIVPVPQDLQPLGDERAVHAFERHHVAHGRKRNEIEQAEKIWLGTLRIGAGAAERTRGGDEEEEHHASRSQMALAGEIVLPVGIEHGEGRRQHLVGLVMIDDDHINAARVRSLDGRASGGAAIDGDDEGGTLLGERCH